MKKTDISYPSDDERWKKVQQSLRKNRYSKDALIEVLHVVQEEFGYISEEAITYVAESLKLPYSRVYGVVTFYHFFSLIPKAEHNCIVCTGTACYVKGSSRILQQVSKLFGIREGETTKDGRFSLSTARCTGICSIAPQVIIDDKVYGNLKDQDISKILPRW
jgi:bidirectional [NiFe] hydrogenase diaphorase subunit